MKRKLDEAQEFANDLIDFISYSPSTFHVVRNIKAALLRKGFKELLLSESWQVEKEGKYFVSQNDTALAAFVVGMGQPEKDGFRVIAAHTDSPAIKIKPHPEMVVGNSYIKLNPEVYGGAILNTWFDRPLSIAGRVVLKSKNPFVPEVRQLNVKRPVLQIPNLAIHFNREVNDGVKINPQKDLCPLLACVKSPLEGENYLAEIISKELNISPDSILDFDLSLYDIQKGCLTGADNEFISSAKLDNLSMIHAGMESLFNSPNINATQVMVCFDNEEIGSRTRQGAASPFLKNIIERLILRLGGTAEDYFRSIYNSFMISADCAHALHPNYTEMSCPTNRPVINKGPVLKYNASQKYCTDAESAAVFANLAALAHSPLQKFTNRSDLSGGSTLGSITTAQTDFKCVDVGTPILAMHSIRELGGVYDHFNMKNIFKVFFSI
ncbi:MAG: M18 family aminopeptidase [Bacteroidales bacterium]|jgi:aspartyl aminopeptidase|nr:M18 family aminopeptidase [Bacteroidales bacterium]MBR6278957.1 M18 family aminopeptidase [Bacteroidales bacterium]